MLSQKQRGGRVQFPEQRPSAKASTVDYCLIRTAQQEACLLPLVLVQEREQVPVLVPEQVLLRLSESVLLRQQMRQPSSTT